MLRNKFSQLSPENDKCLKTINKPLFFRKFVGVGVVRECVCVWVGGLFLLFLWPVEEEQLEAGHIRQLCICIWMNYDVWNGNIKLYEMKWFIVFGSGSGGGDTLWVYMCMCVEMEDIFCQRICQKQQKSMHRKTEIRFWRKKEG
jgi:hypothetical protein